MTGYNFICQYDIWNEIENRPSFQKVAMFSSEKWKTALIIAAGWLFFLTFQKFQLIISLKNPFDLRPNQIPKETFDSTKRVAVVRSLINLVIIVQLILLTFNNYPTEAITRSTFVTDNNDNISTHKSHTELWFQQIHRMHARRFPELKNNRFCKYNGRRGIF